MGSEQVETGGEVDISLDFFFVGGDGIGTLCVYHFSKRKEHRGSAGYNLPPSPGMPCSGVTFPDSI